MDRPRPPDADGPRRVVVDLDEVRVARTVGGSRLTRLVDLHAQDVGRSVRVQALERLGRT